MTFSLTNDILSEIHRLAPDQQKKLLDYARSLPNKLPQGTAGKDLLHFAGIIDKPDLRKMAQAIDEDCENINHYEW